MPAITNVNELQDISLDLAGDYWLTNDIDASGFGFTPLGTFTGSLDGMGFDINDLTITINGAGAQYGALINTNQGTIMNLGLVDCVISVTAIEPFARAYASGLVVHNDGGTVTSCFSTGTITATAVASTSGYYSEAGGLIVWPYGTVSKSYSTATVTVDGRNAQGGGFSSDCQSGGDISECYAAGNVIVTGSLRAKAAGFLVVTGINSPVSNCYARGNASATGGSTGNWAAGFILDIDNIVTNCFSTGTPTGASGIGGFCHDDSDGTVTNCFWDTQTSGTAVSDGGTGKTTSQMKTKSTFTTANWDFIIIWGINGITNDGYAFFWAMPPEPLPDAPRRTVAVQDKITLESIRNVEMAAGGRFYINEEGNAVYKSRYARNA